MEEIYDEIKCILYQIKIIIVYDNFNNYSEEAVDTVLDKLRELLKDDDKYDII
jgi:Ni,Fe-hydrogenase maturation factor